MINVDLSKYPEFKVHYIDDPGYNTIIGDNVVMISSDTSQFLQIQEENTNMIDYYTGNTRYETLIINCISVQKEFRNRGLGTNMLNIVEEIALNSKKEINKTICR